MFSASPSPNARGASAGGPVHEVGGSAPFSTQLQVAMAHVDENLTSCLSGALRFSGAPEFSRGCLSDAVAAAWYAPLAVAHNATVRPYAGEDDSFKR